MRRQVWRVEEIRDILVATNEASGMSVAAVGARSGKDGEAVCAYRQGFQAALVAVAIAVGLSPLVADLRAEERSPNPRSALSERRPF